MANDIPGKPEDEKCPHGRSFNGFSECPECSRETYERSKVRLKR